MNNGNDERCGIGVQTWRAGRISSPSTFSTAIKACLVEYAEILREVIRNVKFAHPFHIDAMVILPDHLHALWSLPAGDCDYPMRWMLIKSGFSRRLPLGERRTSSRRAKGERGIWQRRYWEHLIRDERDFAYHADYIHYNPIKHGYVPRVANWPWSSFHRFVRHAVLPADWGGESSMDNGDERTFGERQ